MKNTFKKNKILVKLNYYSMLLTFLLVLSCSKETITADILILNGVVYNGVNEIPSSDCVAIKEDKIIYIGDPNKVQLKAKETIDAKGQIVSPGFIDPHTHADEDLANPNYSHNKPFLFQGVTTVAIGNDGNSLYPTSNYKKLFESHGIGTNVVLFVGHGTIRKEVMGSSDKEASSEDILKMQTLIQQEMKDGAIGLSAGLFYAPGSYSNTNEVIALAKTVAENNGIYDTHLRDESSFSIGLYAAVEEAIKIGKQAQLPIHISHIKCLGVDVWNQSDNIIKLIENSQNEGVEITANQYPYEASATGLKSAVVPRWAESGGIDSLFIRLNNNNLKMQILNETKNNITRRGGPDKLLIVESKNSKFIGKNLQEISDSLKVNPENAIFKILEYGSTKVASFNMNPNDILNFMKRPWVVTGSDGGSGHPRKYGSFARKFNEYVKNTNVLSIASFINNSSSKTAEILKIDKRGKLLEGYFADIIIFNQDTFSDKADYENPFLLSQGITYSIINGKIAIKNGIFSDNLNGKVLEK